MSASPYTETFRKLQPQYDPLLIESYVRLEYSTLDHLPMAKLRSEAAIAAACIDEVGVEAATKFARTMGLVK